MKASFIIARKETLMNFRSWQGVLVFVFFYLLSGAFFLFLVFNYAKISAEALKSSYETVAGLGLTRFIFGSLFMNMGVVLIFLIPLLTMRSFAEERKQKTLELLYTYPLSDFDIVWGKFLGLVWFFELLILPSCYYLVVLTGMGGQIDWGPVLVGYFGFWLMGNAFLSLGLFISSLCENQTVSAVMTFGVLIFFWILEWLAGIANGHWAKLLTLISPYDHYREFTLGVFDLSHFAYFTFFCLYFLFLTLRVVETRNWKG